MISSENHEGTFPGELRINQEFPRNSDYRFSPYPVILAAVTGATGTMEELKNTISGGPENWSVFRVNYSAKAARRFGPLRV
jgi:hypothetical protein